MLKKEIAKCKEITPLNLSEAPFEIPNSWAWVKLGDICEIFTGATPKTSNAENFGDFIPFLNPGDIDNNGNVIYSNRGLTEKGLKEARKIEANSILVVCIGGLIGKACLVDRECTCNQQINVAKPFFTEATLLYYFINSAYFQSTIKANSTGTATPIINKNLFEQILIPLLSAEK
ncbi:restriction endonuclease subunit S [Campylobacter upsaliensis]